MIFTIEAIANKKAVKLTYNNLTNTVRDSNGKVLNPLRNNQEILSWYKEAKKIYFSDGFTPTQNSNKFKRRLATLDITFGLNCNFNCQYCSQRPFRGKAYSAKPSDVEPFMAMLERNKIEVNPDGKVFLWGGEPLVYWKTIRKIVPLLRKRYPSQQFEIITNGSLLTKEKIDFFNKHNVVVSVSDDGINNNRCEAAIEAAHKNDKLYEYAAQTMKTKFFIGVVPAMGNADVIKIIDTIKKRIPSIQRIYTENVVRCFTDENRDGLSAEMMYRLSDNDLKLLHDSRFISVVENYFDGDKPRSTFRLSLAAGIQVVEKAQCGVGSGNMLCVNLKGDIYSCHIFASSGLELGHLDNLDEAVIRWHTSFNNRRMCKDCVLLSLCRGDCSRMSDSAHDMSCENRYASLFPVFRKIFSETFGVWVNAVTPKGPLSRVMSLLNNRNPTLKEYRATVGKQIPIVPISANKDV